MLIETITNNSNNLKPESPHVAKHEGVVIDFNCSQAFLFGENNMSKRFIRKDQPPLCACGCGERVKWNKYKKKWNIYLKAHHWRGVTRSKQTRLKMSLAAQNMSNEHKTKMSLAAMGRKVSRETRKKISITNIGNKPWNKGKTGIYSDEHKQKLSIANSGKNNPMFGKIMSRKTREKMSIAQKNRSKELELKMAIGRMKCRTDNYCDAWSDLEYKKDCRKNYCEICGIKEKKTKGKDGRLFSNLVLHHKDLNGKNCNPDNLPTLCRSCHAKLHQSLRKQKGAINEIYA